MPQFRDVGEQMDGKIDAQPNHQHNEGNRYEIEVANHETCKPGCQNQRNQERPERQQRATVRPQSDPKDRGDQNQR